jgi:hypothetical protein
VFSVGDHNGSGAWHQEEDLCSESSWDPNDDHLADLEIPYLKPDNTATPKMGGSPTKKSVG